jgi:hypothetical protein
MEFASTLPHNTNNTRVEMLAATATVSSIADGVPSSCKGKRADRRVACWMKRMIVGRPDAHADADAETSGSGVVYAGTRHLEPRSRDNARGEGGAGVRIAYFAQTSTGRLRPHSTSPRLELGCLKQECRHTVGGHLHNAIFCKASPSPLQPPAAMLRSGQQAFAYGTGYAEIKWSASGLQSLLSLSALSPTIASSPISCLATSQKQKA